ncbi:MAG: hypothetical protein IT370_34445 [Deltaproteobacteria bacterium]|nr:hypothetical protein [Deltaproteobacteria bacterium]
MPAASVAAPAAPAPGTPVLALAPSPLAAAHCVDSGASCGLSLATSRWPPSDAISLPVARSLPSMMHLRRQLVGVALAGDEIFVTVDHCPQCAAVRRFTTVADVSAVSDEHLTRLQTWMGLPATPLLRSGAAWRQAFGL